MTEVSLDESQLDDLSGKVAIVTGGASGIGKKLVELLHKKNATVVFCDLNVSAGEQLANDLGINAEFIRCNVLEWKELRGVFSQTKKFHGHIDIVYANAGNVTGLDAFDDTLDKDGELSAPNMGVIDVCLKSVIATSKLALSYFKSNPKPGGSLILTSSAAGYNPRPNIVLYSAAKTGVAGFLRALSQFVEPNSGITVNAVAPGPTVTAMFDENAAAQARGMGLTVNTAEYIALGQVFLAGKKEWNGKCLTLIGGKASEVEGPLEETRSQWFGKHNTELAKMAQNINYDHKRQPLAALS